MEKLTDKPPMSRTDKHFLAAFALLWIAAGVLDMAMDANAPSAAPVQTEDKPLAVLTREMPLEQPQLLEAMAFQLKPAPYREDVPLDRELQSVLREVCADSGVPVSLALGLIEVESGFHPDVVSSEGAYGLCQLNPKYFPSGLTPAENLAAGVAYLGELLERYSGDTAAALVAYNQGSYKGVVTDYAKNVLQASEKWGNR